VLRVELDRLREVLEGGIEFPQEYPDRSAGAPGVDELGIEIDGLREVVDASRKVPQLEQEFRAQEVGAGVVRFELDRMIEILEGAVEIPLRPQVAAAREVGVHQLGRQLDGSLVVLRGGVEEPLLVLLAARFQEFLRRLSGQHLADRLEDGLALLGDVGIRVGRRLLEGRNGRLAEFLELLARLDPRLDLRRPEFLDELLGGLVLQHEDQRDEQDHAIILRRECGGVGSSLPLEATKRESPSGVEEHLLPLQEGALSDLVVGLAPRADLPLRIHDAVPGHADFLRERGERVADLPGLSSESREARDLAVGRHATPGDPFHLRVDSLVAAFRHGL
jgi:hypothetical protein